MASAKNYRGWAKFAIRGLPDNFRGILDLANEFKYELMCLTQKKEADLLDLRNRFFPEYWEERQRFFNQVVPKAGELKKQLATHDMLIGGLTHEMNELTSLHAAEKSKGGDVSRIGNQIKLLKVRLAEAKVAKKVAVKELNSYAAYQKTQYEIVQAAGIEYRERCAAFAARLKQRSEEIDALGYGPSSHLRRDYPWPQWDVGSFEEARHERLRKFDKDTKELSRQFQLKGLHSDIRAEIVKAVEAMTFENWRPPRWDEMQPCNSLSLQLKSTKRTDYDAQPTIVKGRKKYPKKEVPCPTFDELLASGWSGLKLTYLGSGSGGRDDCHLYHVAQNIGTADDPQWIEYDILLHRPWPKHARLQQWHVQIDERPYVTVILSTEGEADPQPVSYVANDYSTGRERADGGLSVAHFVGESINEEVYLPSWLVRRFHDVYAIDAAMDKSAGDLLESLGLSTKGNKIRAIRRAAVESLRASNWLDWRDREWARRNKLHSRAINARRHIYRVAAYRIAKLHTHLIEDPAELATLKENKNRDRRREKSLNDTARRNFQIAAPGELRKYLRESKLDCSIKVKTAYSSRTCLTCGGVNIGDDANNKSKMVKCENCPAVWDRDMAACIHHATRGGVDPATLSVTRETDVVTSYIRSLGVKSGPKPYSHAAPSWIHTGAKAA
jgi:hypothetical protein